MKENLYELFGQQSNLTLQEITLNIISAAVLGMLIFVSYAISHRGTIYSKKFNVSLVILAALTGTVMTVIGNNIALSLGMVGALSIVRFRTAIKDSRDTVYIFWSIIVGICCGVGDYLVATVGSAVVFVLIFILGCIKAENRMLIIVRGQREKRDSVQSTIFKLFGKKAILRVINTTEHVVEIIYEISSKDFRESERNQSGVIDSLYALGDIEYVNVVMQNDEISN